MFSTDFNLTQISSPVIVHGEANFNLSRSDYVENVVLETQSSLIINQVLADEVVHGVIFESQSSLITSYFPWSFHIYGVVFESESSLIIDSVRIESFGWFGTIMGVKNPSKIMGIDVLNLQPKTAEDGYNPIL